MTGKLEPRETRSYTMTAVTTMVSMARMLVIDRAARDENAVSGLQSISTQRSAMYAPIRTPMSGIMLQAYPKATRPAQRGGGRKGRSMDGDSVKSVREVYKLICYGCSQTVELPTGAPGKAEAARGKGGREL